MLTHSKTYQAYKNSPYKSIKHSTYFDVYDRLFSPYRGKKITFIEIGVLGGGSLFMWREFFGPDARIIGVDLNPGAKRWEKDGFEIYTGSQSDEAFWSEFTSKIGMVDIVLDDGGHTYEQQVITVEALLPFINDGGLLVVEDTHTSYMGGFGAKSHSFIDYAKSMIDKINLRFSAFADQLSEKRVWGLLFYESFVVFEVNKKALAIKSEPTDNGGKDLHAEDYRNIEDNILSRFEQTAEKIGLKRIKPIYRPLKKLARILTEKQKAARIKKYF